jgi:hypothetical protein
MGARVEGRPMKEIVVDAKLAEALKAATDTVRIVGPEGRSLGMFRPIRLTAPPPGYKPPFTDEELAERSKVRTGRPLADIIRDLESKHGKS